MKTAARVRNLYVEIDEDDIDIMLVELPHALSTQLDAKEAADLISALSYAVSTYVARTAASAVEAIDKAKRRREYESETARERLDKSIDLLNEVYSIAVEVQKHLENMKTLGSKISKMYECYTRGREWV